MFTARLVSSLMALRSSRVSSTSMLVTYWVLEMIPPLRVTETFGEDIVLWMVKAVRSRVPRLMVSVKLTVRIDVLRLRLKEST